MFSRSSACRTPRAGSLGALGEGPVRLPNAELDSVFPPLLLPALPAPDGAGSAPAGSVAGDYHLRGAQAEGCLTWPQTLPHLP